MDVAGYHGDEPGFPLCPSRSVFESVIYSLRDVVELIRKMSYTVKQVRTSGGGAQSPLLRQIHADVFGSR